MEEFTIPPNIVHRSNDSDGRECWVAQFRLTGRHTREFLSELVQIPEVYAIEREAAISRR